MSLLGIKFFVSRHPSAPGPERQPPIFRCTAWQFIVTFTSLFSRPRESFSLESALFLYFSWRLTDARCVMICTQVILRGGQLRLRSARCFVYLPLERGKEQRNVEQHARLFTPAVRFLGDLCRRDFLLAERTKSRRWFCRPSERGRGMRRTVPSCSDHDPAFAVPGHTSRCEVTLRQAEERSCARRHDP